MSNPASQPRRLFAALLVLLVLGGVVATLYAGRLDLAVLLGLVGFVLLLMAARPSGARHS